MTKSPRGVNIAQDISSHVQSSTSSKLAAGVLALVLGVNGACAEVIVNAEGDTDGGGVGGAGGTTATSVAGSGGDTLSTTSDTTTDTTSSTTSIDCTINTGTESAALQFVPPQQQVQGGLGIGMHEVLKFDIVNNSNGNATFINKDGTDLYAKGDGFIRVRLNPGGTDISLTMCRLMDPNDKMIDYVNVPNDELPEPADMYFDMSHVENECGTFEVPPQSEGNKKITLTVQCELFLENGQSFAASVWDKSASTAPISLGAVPNAIPAEASVGYHNGIEYIVDPNAVPIPILGPAFVGPAL